MAPILQMAPILEPRRPAHRNGRSERGVALVEFALVSTLLFGLLFGILDFGNAYSRTLDVRHGAREGARLAAVNYTAGTTTVGAAQRALIIGETCRRMDGGKGATVQVSFESPTSGDPQGAVGQAARIVIARPMTSLTGFYGPLLDGKTIRSEVRIRIEVKASWTAGSGTCA